MLHLYKASRDLELNSIDIESPQGVKYQGFKLSDNIAIIPILRAGVLCVANETTLSSYIFNRTRNG